MAGSDRAVVTTSYLGKALTATGATTSYVRNLADIKTFQLSGRTTAGAGTASVQIEGTLDDPGFDASVHWDLVGAFAALTLGTSDTNSAFSSQDRFRFYRANVTALTGTGANVDVKVGM